MADKVESKKTEEPKNEQIEETEGEETETTEEVAKTEKGFDQAQVNRIVQTRIKKVKTEYESQISDLSNQLEEYENVLKPIVEGWMKDEPEELKELLAEASLLKQYQVLSKKQVNQSKKTIDSTPKGKEDAKKTPRMPRASV